MNILTINIIFMTYLSCVPSTECTSPTVPTGTRSGNDSDNTSTVNVYNNIANLNKELLKNYDTRVIPRKNISQPIDVLAIFLLQGVLELDTVSQKLSILGYFTLLWKNEILVWNASLHEGIDYIKLPIDQVWVPPLRLSLTYGGKGNIRNSDDIVELYSDGKTMLTTDNTYNVFCDVNIKFYPFDKHDCVFYVFITQMNSLDVNITNFTAELSSIFFKRKHRMESCKISIYQTGIFILRDDTHELGIREETRVYIVYDNMPSSAFICNKRRCVSGSCPYWRKGVYLCDDISVLQCLHNTNK